MKPNVLLVGQMMPHIMAALDTAYDVHRLYEAGDRDAILLHMEHMRRVGRSAEPTAGNDRAGSYRAFALDRRVSRHRSGAKCSRDFWSALGVRNSVK